MCRVGHWVRELAAVVAAVPITALLLRRRRRATYRELLRRVQAGDIIAGVPANWLDSTDRLMWSGCLTLAPNGTLHWEPDRASVVKRGAAAREWDQSTLAGNILPQRRGSTGERYEVLAIRDNDTPIATFAVFDEIGPWRVELGFGTHPDGT